MYKSAYIALIQPDNKRFITCNLICLVFYVFNMYTKKVGHMELEIVICYTFEALWSINLKHNKTHRYVFC